MKLSFVLLALLLFSVKSIAANSPRVYLFPVVASGRTIILDLDKISSLKIKEVQKLIGRRLTLKEKIGFTILKQQVKKRGVTAVEKEIKDNGKTSFILGLIGLAGLVVPLIGFFSLPLAIIAIAVGNKAKKLNPDDKKAKTGVIFSWITIGLLVTIMAIVVLVIAFPVG